MRHRKAVQAVVVIVALPIVLGGGCSDPTLSEANERAATALEQGQPAQAAGILKGLGARVQKSPIVLTNLGRAYLELGEVEKGLSELRHAGALARKDDPLLLLLARLFLSYGELGDADRMLERCGPSLREKAEFHLVLGHLLLDAGSSAPEIVAEFQKALRLEPTNHEAADSLLLLLREMTDPAQVERILSQLPQQTVQRTRARLLVGEIRARLGQWAEAAEIAEEIIGVQPDNVSAWVLLAKAQAALGQKRTAETAFQTALNHSGNAPEVAVEYARFLLDENREGRALRFLAAAEENQARRPVAQRLPGLHNLLAAIYARRGQMLLAEQHLLSSLAIELDQPEIRLRLNMIRRTQKTKLAPDESTSEGPDQTNTTAP